MWTISPESQKTLIMNLPDPRFPSLGTDYPGEIHFFEAAYSPLYCAKSILFPRLENGVKTRPSNFLRLN